MTDTLMSFILMNLSLIIDVVSSKMWYGYETKYG
jgi:hypothetical protein